jgi:hypothetical protein
MCSAFYSSSLQCSDQVSCHRISVRTPEEYILTEEKLDDVYGAELK